MTTRYWYCVATQSYENLFRRNAIVSLHERHDGRPVAYVPRPWLWLGTFCLALIVTAFTLASRIEYARKETVRGWVVARQGVVRLTHDSLARVTSVERQRGDSVRQGDVIAYLSADGLLGDGSAAVGAILDVLREDLAEIDSRAAAARSQLEADNEALARQVRGVDKELRALALQERQLQGRADRSGATLLRFERAFRDGAIAEIELLRRQDEHSALRQAGARLQQEQDRLQRERGDLEARRQALSTDFEMRLSELASLRNELRQRITRNESARLRALEAPIDGTIATLDLVAGSTVRGQQLLVTIVPGDATLAADVYVPSRAVGLIAPGQSVRLRFDAFPHEQFGMARGRVESVAEFVLLPPDMPSTFGLREAAYKVRIGLERDHVTDMHGSYQLKPGMLLVAEIVLENRRLIDWLRMRLKRHL